MLHLVKYVQEMSIVLMFLFINRTANTERKHKEKQSALYFNVNVAHLQSHVNSSH